MNGITREEWRDEKEADRKSVVRERVCLSV